jgi:hypothetical protein
MKLPRPFSYYFTAYYDLDAREARDRLRKMIARSRELLSEAPPDTFLGRQHHDPVPLPHEEERG